MDRVYNRIRVEWIVIDLKVISYNYDIGNKQFDCTTKFLVRCSFKKGCKTKTLKNECIMKWCRFTFRCQQSLKDKCEWFCPSLRNTYTYPQANGFEKFRNTNRCLQADNFEKSQADNFEKSQLIVQRSQKYKTNCVSYTLWTPHLTLTHWLSPMMTLIGLWWLWRHRTNTSYIYSEVRNLSNFLYCTIQRTLSSLFSGASMNEKPIC